MREICLSSIRNLIPVAMPAVKIHFPPQYVEITEHARVGFNVWDLTVDKTDDLFREYIRKAKSVTLDGSDKCVFVLKGRKILFYSTERLAAKSGQLQTDME